jgi:hypothetical protein
LKLNQRGRDHALHAAVGAKLVDLAAGGGAKHLAAGDIDQRQRIGVGVFDINEQPVAFAKVKLARLPPGQELRHFGQLAGHQNVQNLLHRAAGGICDKL